VQDPPLPKGLLISPDLLVASNTAPVKTVQLEKNGLSQGISWTKEKIEDFFNPMP